MFNYFIAIIGSQYISADGINYLMDKSIKQDLSFLHVNIKRLIKDVFLIEELIIFMYNFIGFDMGLWN